jgi:hypothetical protein
MSTAIQMWQLQYLIKILYFGSVYNIPNTGTCYARHEGLGVGVCYNSSAQIDG